MPPKSAAAQAANLRTAKRKAKDGLEEDKNNVKKRRQADPLSSNKGAPDPDEEDAGFTFTRPVKPKKPLPAPTRASPRNHAKSGPTNNTSATPKAPKPPVESAYRGQSNGSDSFVALPVSDTPIIRKNQQLRQNGGDGRRRSSLSMRGKRASSIGNGFQSLPHPDIPASEFYKHISEELPDPVRMKQLLAWCARRSIDESKTRPSLHGAETDEQIQAANIARTIEEEVLKDLIENKITTSWYHQPDHPLATLEKRPHPQNVNNSAKIKEMEERIAQLKAEEVIWSDLLVKHTQQQRALHAQEDTVQGQISGIQSESEERFAKNYEQAVDLDLLPAQEAEFVHSLSTRSAAQFDNSHGSEDWLLDAESNLEFNVDTLLHSLHQQKQYLKQVEGTSAKLLEAAAQKLAAAERKGAEQSQSQGISTIDVLRQISRTH